jgi:hypothetical protein
MALNILQLHKKAFLDLLDADNTSPALIVLDGKVPGPPEQTSWQPPPYVLLYFALRTPSGVDEPDKVSLENTSDVINATAYCHSVGGDQHAALAVAGRVRTALRGVVPVIAGRVCFPIGQVDSQPIQRDETTGTAVFDAVDIWQFTSLPG